MMCYHYAPMPVQPWLPRRSPTRANSERGSLAKFQVLQWYLKSVLRLFVDKTTRRRAHDATIRPSVASYIGTPRSSSTRQACNGGMSEAHAACRLTTNLPNELKVTDAPLELPTRLTRFGLSEVVNHLLNAEKLRRFDFVVNGELLRGTLAQSMERHEISGEQILDIEYIELLAPPALSSETEHPDWIAGVASAQTHATLHADAAGSFNGIVLAACYDGVAYARTAKGEMLAELRGHSSAVKSVSWLGERRAVTASKDRTLRVWNLSGSQSQGLQAQCEKVATLYARVRVHAHVHITQTHRV
eukprot:6183048-Pleurochrysis_carterae.AAC.3